MIKTLEELRNEIDNIDESIIQLLGKRMAVVKEIGKIKKDLNKEIFDQDRWESLLTKIKQHANKWELNVEFVQKLYEMIHKHAQDIQKKE